MDLASLLARLERLAGERDRVVVGLCGAPGTGKSTLAERLASALGASAVVLPLDGFHLHDDELARLGLSDRKGAPETFDVDGYVTLLRRLRDVSRPIYAPSFDRGRELSLAGAIPVLPEHRYVVTEGNYLLLPGPGWGSVRSTLDECWYVDLDPVVRRQRLVDRHVRHGRTRAAATEWVLRSDEANARLVEQTRSLADVVLGGDQRST